MPDVDVAQPENQTATTEETTQQTETTVDPFAIDESSFMSLSPEQRAALDPVLNKFKETAKSYAQKEREAESKKYEDHIKKAKALDGLVGDPSFVERYNKKTNPQGDIAPKSVASAEEWANAYQALSAGDPMPLEKLQSKLVMSVGGPQLQRTQQEMQVLRAENELNKLWGAHPDAKDLDTIGREEDPEAPSLLQLAAQASMQQNGMVNWEKAYALAKKVSLSMENKGKRAAMGLVSEKKGSMTERPATNSRDEGVQYVDTMEEAMTANIEAAMDGRKVRYQVKK
jgi:hypothetical protein